MKKKIFLINFLVLLIVSCKEEDSIIEPSIDGDGINIQEEIKSIVWDKLCGRAVYSKNGKYLLMDTKDKRVKILGTADLFWTVKMNSDNTLLTGMQYNTTIGKYNLIGVDLDGKKTQLCTSLDFETPYFDWLPENRLVYIKQSGQVYIEEIALNTNLILPLNDLACSPDGNKILVSTYNYDSDSTHIFYQLNVINVNSGQQSTISLCSMTLVQGVGNLPRMIQMKVSYKTGKILYVESGIGWLFWVPYAHLFMQGCIQVKTDVCFPNWCPIVGKQLTYCTGDPGSPVSSTYWRNNYNSEEILVIPYGRMIAWFN